MRDGAVDFTGSIPAFYDHGLGPVFFAEFADDIARRAAATAPSRVLEIAAGTGIVTRRLRDVLSREAHLTATDLNPPMLAVARAKFNRDCQFGVMFFPDKDKGYREAYRVLMGRG